MEKFIAAVAVVAEIIGIVTAVRQSNAETADSVKTTA